MRLPRFFPFIPALLAAACGSTPEPVAPATGEPTLAEARETVAACRTERGDPDRWQRAATAFRNAAANGSLPADAAPEADLAAAMTALEAGRAAEARTTLERAVAARSGWDCALAALGEARFTLG